MVVDKNNLFLCMIHKNQKYFSKGFCLLKAFLIAILLPLPAIASIDIPVDKVNLALRRAADKLLRISGDSTSQIPSVERLNDGIWLVRLDQVFNYDSLPAVLHASFLLHGIEIPYDVTVRKCEDGTIDLGYNYLDFTEGDGVACGGRQRSEGCHYIEVAFLYSKAKNHFTSANIFLIIFIIFGVFGLWFFRRSKFSMLESSKLKDIHSSDFNWLEFGNSKLDVANQVLICQDSKLNLTYREAKLLFLFANNINKVLERDYIIQKVWADEGVLVGRSVDVFVSRLRKKISDDPTLGLSVVHGVGYKLESSKVA